MKPRRAKHACCGRGDGCFPPLDKSFIAGLFKTLHADEAHAEDKGDHTDATSSAILTPTSSGSWHSRSDGDHDIRVVCDAASGILFCNANGSDAARSSSSGGGLYAHSGILG